MSRTDIVIPAEALPTLRIPPLALTNGAPDPEWVDVPMSRWRFRRRPSQRVPLDPRTARRARRYIRLAPWSLLRIFLSLAALCWYYVTANGSGHLSYLVTLVGLVAPVVISLASPLLEGRLPVQTPRRDPNGDLRISDVPLAVAQEWVRQNPGVNATDEPAPRPHAPRFYATWSVGLILAAIGLGVVLAGDGRADFILLWMLVPALFVGGVATAYKIGPPGRPTG